ncbi:hypothetical protein MKK88_15205 [Methylobacterium sp. E-005]|uniref:hypothetical protein n=1 Tax=Methylobacterium sp. E-005 TaxID=2836549 RepID=UPI001FBB8CA7|nr:hypothetical protein [Methylobacterium sp. E-005]MCJ2087321.1 hypothetical protein [Methylobacterium sp. E-005]
MIANMTAISTVCAKILYDNLRFINRSIIWDLVFDKSFHDLQSKHGDVNMISVATDLECQDIITASSLYRHNPQRLDASMQNNLGFKRSKLSGALRLGLAPLPAGGRHG